MLGLGLFQSLSLELKLLNLGGQRAPVPISICIPHTVPHAQLEILNHPIYFVFAPLLTRLGFGFFHGVIRRLQLRNLQLLHLLLSGLHLGLCLLGVILILDHLETLRLSDLMCLLLLEVIAILDLQGLCILEVTIFVLDLLGLYLLEIIIIRDLLEILRLSYVTFSRLLSFFSFF